MLKTYNGFDHYARMKAGAWQNRHYAAGTLARPTACCACGQTQGAIIHHCEDYSEPFTVAKTCKYPLCYRCHTAVHCRFKSPAMWLRYRAAINAGVRYAAIPGNSFARWCAEHPRSGDNWPTPEHTGAPPAWRVLDEIDAYLATR